MRAFRPRQISHPALNALGYFNFAISLHSGHFLAKTEASDRAELAGYAHMLRSAVIVIALSGFVWVSAARAERPAIVVEGNHRLGEDFIRAYFPTNKDRPWTEEELDAALKAMYRSN